MRPNKIGQLAYIDHDNFDGFLNLMNPLFLICDIIDEDFVKVILLGKNIPLMEEPPFLGISSFEHTYYYQGALLDKTFIHDNASHVESFFRNSLTVFQSTPKMVEDMFLPFPIQLGCHASIESKLSNFMDSLELGFKHQQDV